MFTAKLLLWNAWCSKGKDICMHHRKLECWGFKCNARSEDPIPRLYKGTNAHVCIRDICAVKVPSSLTLSLSPILM